MFPGISSFIEITTDIPIASSTVLITTGLKAPIAANEKKKCRWWVPFTTGATGGAKCEVLVPAGGSYYLTSIVFHNSAAGTVIQEVITAAAAFGNALANAANHFVEIEAIIHNGATAGDIDLQMAQNSSDVLTLTILKGGWLQTIQFN